jgi:transposase
MEKRHELAVCACCQKDLRDQEADELQKRQGYDLPPMKLVVTEHQADVKRCRCGHLNRADFPAEVGSHVQYGPGLNSLLVYLQDDQLLPYGRTRELVSELWGHSISTGTLYNIRRFAFDQLASFEQRLKKVKMNVSGGFRSLEGTQVFAHMRGYVMTARKQGINMLEALRDVFVNNTLAYQLAVD